LISTIVMFQVQNRRNYCCVLQGHYNDKRDKTFFSQHQTSKTKTKTKTTYSVQDQDRYFGLRPVVS